MFMFERVFVVVCDQLCLKFDFVSTKSSFICGRYSRLEEAYVGCL